MRPSSISFSSVIRAISRRMPSNDESTTAFGVSSMMKSTPVRCSSVADVAPLTADDAALHVVGGQLDERDGRLGGRARGDPLQRVGDEVARAPLRLGRRLLLHLPDAAGELVADLLLATRRGSAAAPRRSSSPRSARARRCCASLSSFRSSCSCLRWTSRSATPCSRRVSSVSFRSMSSSFARTRSSIFTHRVAPLAQLRLELGAQLDRLLARLDRRLAARRVGVAARLVEQQRRARAARPRAASPRCSRSTSERARRRRLRVRSRLPRQRAWALLRAVEPARRAFADRRSMARPPRAAAISAQCRLGVGALQLPTRGSMT